MAEFDPQLCEIRHAEIERRVSVVEKSLNENFQRMYDKIETQTLAWAQQATDNAKRPGWATLTIITILSSGCIGLSAALLK